MRLKIFVLVFVLFFLVISISFAFSLDCPVSKNKVDECHEADPTVCKDYYKCEDGNCRTCAGPTPFGKCSPFGDPCEPCTVPVTLSGHECKKCDPSSNTKYIPDTGKDGKPCDLPDNQKGVCAYGECVEKTTCTAHCFSNSGEVKEEDDNAYDALDKALKAALTIASENCQPADYECPSKTRVKPRIKCVEDVGVYILKSEVYPKEEADECEGGGKSGTAIVTEGGWYRKTAIKKANDAVLAQINSYNCPEGCDKKMTAGPVSFKVWFVGYLTWFATVNMPYTIECIELPEGKKKFQLWEGLVDMQFNKYCKKYPA